jgi:urease accessory protein
MIHVSKRAPAGAVPTLHLMLPYDSRTKSRLRTRLSSGEEIGLFLERGTVLRGGDRLEADDGRIIEVIAAEEEVSTVHSDDAATLARVSYHLGNRHVPLQIGNGYVRYLHDHVLDDMVRGLGLSVQVERAPFEPEAGAYSGYASTHAHHGHDGHGHSHG